VTPPLDHPLLERFQAWMEEGGASPLSALAYRVTAAGLVGALLRPGVGELPVDGWQLRVAVCWAEFVAWTVATG
jgi:hypothetical protein